MEIEQSRPGWLEDFADLRIVVMRAAPAGAYIHHIGSTAVPGLAAKDVIDIQLTVDDLEKVDSAAFEHEVLDAIRR
ncbi:GrpB family protein [Rhizobium sp. LjRoot258]|uniref:GrpB family protein n=1 Tax=Rhizobium sp. LjRoot258 TaxID=3342299 RepID=UPI003ED0A962